MGFGAVFTALAALQSSIRSPRASSGGRRRRRGRRVWRRTPRNHRYRSRPQWRRPLRRSESSATNTTAPAAANVQAATRSVARVQRDADAERRGPSLNGDRPSTDNWIRSNTTLDVPTDGHGGGERIYERIIGEPTTPSLATLGTDAADLHNGEGKEMDCSTSSASGEGMVDVELNGGSMKDSLECGILEDAISAREMSAPGRSDPASSDLSMAAADKPGTSSCEMRSHNSADHGSEKCLGASSVLTADSGYTERSVNSIKPHIAGDVSGCIDTRPIERKVSDTATTGDEKKRVSFSPLETDKISTKEEAVMVDGSCYSTMFNGSSSTGPQVQVVDSLVPPSLAEVDTTSSESFGLQLSTVDEDKSVSESSVGNSETVDGEGEVENEKCERSEVFDRAEKKWVALEAMEMSVDGGAVVGSLVVCNDCYFKWVGVRHSVTDWTSHQDTQAQWVESLEVGELDRFEFRVALPESGSYRMELAFFCNQYWDNNEGENHVVSCNMLWED